MIQPARADVPIRRARSANLPICVSGGSVRSYFLAPANQDSQNQEICERVWWRGTSTRAGFQLRKMKQIQLKKTPKASEMILLILVILLIILTPYIISSLSDRKNGDNILVKTDLIHQKKIRQDSGKVIGGD